MKNRIQSLPIGLAAALLLTMVCFAWCAEEDLVVDPAKVGADYKVQGEYLSEDGKHGAQVIALGDGKFELISYYGGLPGAGWKRGDKMEKAPGELVGDAAQFSSKGWTAEIKGDVLTAYDPDGKELGKLKAIVRKSPTLGKKAPEGATVLFDGSSPDAFKGGKLVEIGGEQLLMAGCESEATFGDHTLHVEFRTPFKPKARGQARGNSGVYVQGRYELQVLDSFGLEGKNNECGGIYSIAEPKVNMCLPPLTWQTYDIDFKAARYQDGKKVENARVTIKHNGVVIHDDLELPKGTPGKLPEGPAGGPVYLQGHGNPVVFRNVWVVKK